ncbi:MAG: BspA family leucine-rich repeat surface protein [Anaerorhabdus sp.]|uniref:BspA family leucine-rich repeat surface protein n=1 Tax=Anaerorhabdus sp. TaxID=1872524 RepID=UPI002FC73162
MKKALKTYFYTALAIMLAITPLSFKASNVIAENIDNINLVIEKKLDEISNQVEVKVEAKYDQELYEIKSISISEISETKNGDSASFIIEKNGNYTIEVLYQEKTQNIETKYSEILKITELKEIVEQNSEIAAENSLFEKIDEVNQIEKNSYAISTSSSWLDNFDYTENSTAIILSQMKTTSSVVDIVIPGSWDNGSGLKQVQINKETNFFNKNVKTVEIKEVAGTKVKFLPESFKLFLNHESINSVSLDGLDVSNVYDFSNAFMNAKNLNQISAYGWNTTNAENMSFMFSNTNVEILHLGNFDTSNVMKMEGIFDNMVNLKSLNLSNWNFLKVTDIDINTANNQTFCKNVPMLSAVSLNNAEIQPGINNLLRQLQSLTSVEFLNIYALRGLTTQELIDSFTNTQTRLKVITNNNVLKDDLNTFSKKIPAHFVYDAGAGTFLDGSTKKYLLEAVAFQQEEDLEMYETLANAMLGNVENPTKIDDEFVDWVIIDGGLDYGWGVYKALYKNLPIYHVNFNANGGSGTMLSAEVVEGFSINLVNSTFIAPADTLFVGWSEIPYPILNREDSNPSLITKYMNVNEDKTVYAVWRVDGNTLVPSPSPTVTPNPSPNVTPPPTPISTPTTSNGVESTKKTYSSFKGEGAIKESQNNIIDSSSHNEENISNSQSIEVNSEDTPTTNAPLETNSITNQIEKNMTLMNIFIALIMVVMTIILFTLRKTKIIGDNTGTATKYYRKKYLSYLAVFLTVDMIILLCMTQNIFTIENIIWFDKWTVIFVLLGLINLTILFLGIRWHKVQDSNKRNLRHIFGTLTSLWDR